MNKIKAILQYFALGLVVGCLASLGFVFLMTCAECANCFCQCGGLGNSYKVKYTGFWTWDAYYNMVSLLSILCGLIGAVYAILSKNPLDLRKKIEYIGFLVAALVLLVFILVKLLMQSALDLNGFRC